MKYIILDCARMERPNLNVVLEQNTLHSSLYEGETGEALEDFAPYLIDLTNTNTKTQEYLKTGTGKSWGIEAISQVSFNELRKHFRRFLMVKMESGESMYFRFYDPRVLRIFLPTCDKAQLIEFFGPVQSFICEDEDPAFALKFYLQNGELKTERLPAASLFSGKEEFNVQAAPTNITSQPTASENPKPGKNLWMD
jgi:hypothetical protein